MPTDDVTAWVAVETDLVLSDATGWLPLLLPLPVLVAAGVEEEEEEEEEGVEGVEEEDDDDEVLGLCLVALPVVVCEDAVPVELP